MNAPTDPKTMVASLRSFAPTDLDGSLFHEYADAVEAMDCENIILRQKLAALTRSLQQIANFDPNNFDVANRAVQMAKTALLIPIPK